MKFILEIPDEMMKVFREEYKNLHFLPLDPPDEVIIHRWIALGLMEYNVDVDLLNIKISSTFKQKED
jgi:hypothetical protein